MKFKYAASDKSKKIKKGVIEGKNKEDVRNIFKKKGWSVISITPQKATLWEKISARGLAVGKVKVIDMVMMSKHLSIMIKAGLPLDESVEILIEQTTSHKLKRILKVVLKKIQGGDNLSDGLSLFPRVFSPFYINMVKVGEAGGTLEENLERLAIQFNKDYELRRRVKSAMLYPILVLTITVFLSMAISIFVLPKLSTLFSSMNYELPLATKILVAVSLFLQNYGVYVFFGIILFVMFIAWLSRQKILRAFFHRVYLEIPIIKRIVIDLNLARFSLILGSLLKSGLPIVEAINITSKVLTNYYYQKALDRSVEDVKAGFQLSVGLEKNSDIFPPVVYRMINVGERTGNLEEVLEYLAEFFETEVDTMTKNLATVVEPLLLVFIGIIVGGVAIAIVSPIYNFLGSIG